MSPDGGLEVLGTLCDTAGVSFNLNWLEEFTSNKRKVNPNSQKRNARSSTKPTASWLYEKGLSGALPKQARFPYSPSLQRIVKAQLGFDRCHQPKLSPTEQPRCGTEIPPQIAPSAAAPLTLG